MTLRKTLWYFLYYWRPSWIFCVIVVQVLKHEIPQNKNVILNTKGKFVCPPCTQIWFILSREFCEIWHRSCHQKLNKSTPARHREKKKKRKHEVDDDQFATRKYPVKSKINRCIFCQRLKYERLHDHNMQSVHVSLENCHLRCKLQDMIVTLVSADLVASGAEYHGSCSTILQKNISLVCLKSEL